jgi:hypothetical protein
MIGLGGEEFGSRAAARRDRYAWSSSACSPAARESLSSARSIGGTASGSPATLAAAGDSPT